MVNSRTKFSKKKNHLQELLGIHIGRETRQMMCTESRLWHKSLQHRISIVLQDSSNNRGWISLYFFLW